MQDLLLLLQGLEVELHHPGTRCSPSRLDALLHPHTHRSSVWVQEVSGWRLRYHQRTLAGDTW